MSIEGVKWIGDGNVSTAGAIPFFYKGEDSLFIVKGRIRGSILPTVDGTAYRYNTFPWPTGKQISLETCNIVARKNMKHSTLWVDDDVEEQFKAILKEEGYIDPSPSDEALKEVIVEASTEKNENSSLLVKEAQQERYKGVLCQVDNCVSRQMKDFIGRVFSCFGYLSGIFYGERKGVTVENDENQSSCAECFDCFF